MHSRALAHFAAILFGLSSPLAESSAQKDIADDGANWVAYGRTPDEQRFSPLTQINPENVSRLGLAWSFELDKTARALQATPLAVDGALYFTTSLSVVYALDARSGRLIWRYDPEAWRHRYGRTHAVNRGVAYADGLIFVASTDGRLIALDARNGRVQWNVRTFGENTRMSSTGAPRVFNGKVIIGNAGADVGARGFVSAYDVRTGRLRWRFYLVPGNPADGFEDNAMAMAAKTWNGQWWRWGGGGNAWNTMVFDAELNRVYVGTGNSSNYNPRSRSPGGGDNLFLASIVALDADSGTYVWHYQVNPSEAWDWKATEDIVQATLEIDGRPRKVLMQAPTNGFFYVLDRTNGQLISAEKLGKVTWATRIDLRTGRPVELPGIRYEDGPSVLWPSALGTHNWRSMAFNPKTGLVYLPYMQLGGRYESTSEDLADIESKTLDKVAFGSIGARWSPVIADDNDGKGELLAWDPMKQQARWRVKYSYGCNGGIVTTASKLLFHGTADGWFQAYHAATGRSLWRSYVGQGVMAAPATYAVGGKQYVSVLAGYGLCAGADPGWRYGEHLPRVVTFTLDGTAKLADAPRPGVRPVRPVDDPQLTINPVRSIRGQKLWRESCGGVCHIWHASAPDLRESVLALNRESFKAVVQGGLLASRGMPRFPDFSDEDIADLYLYVRRMARDVGQEAPRPVH